MQVLIDGAQAIAHQVVDMQDLQPDFYCFSGHKMYGPTGIGVCYAADSVIDDMHPISFGGDMIETVKKEGTTFTQPPLKFEAGTPPIVEAIGLHAAIKYIESIGRDAIQHHENELTAHALDQLNALDWITLIGQLPNRSSAISFNVNGIHPHDLGTILDNDNVAIRVGHHCAQPTMARFKCPQQPECHLGYTIK